MTQDLDSLDTYQLIDLYNQEFGKDRTVNYWGDRFGIKVTDKNHKFSGLKQYQKKIYALEEYLIKRISDHRRKVAEKQLYNDEVDRLMNIGEQPDVPKPVDKRRQQLYNDEADRFMNIGFQPDVFTKQRSHDERFKEYKSYSDMKNHRDDIQAVLDSEIAAMKANPQKWTLHLKNLDEEQRKSIFDELLSFMQNELSKLYSTYSKFRVNYCVNGVWKSEPLTPEVYNKLFEKFTEKSFVYDYGVTNTEYDIDRISNMIEEDILPLRGR